MSKPKRSSNNCRHKVCFLHIFVFLSQQILQAARPSKPKKSTSQGPRAPKVLRAKLIIKRFGLPHLCLFRWPLFASPFFPRNIFSRKKMCEIFLYFWPCLFLGSSIFLAFGIFFASANFWLWRIFGFAEFLVLANFSLCHILGSPYFCVGDIFRPCDMFGL